MNRYSNESKDLVFGQDDDVENGDDNDDNNDDDKDDDDDDNDDNDDPMILNNRAKNHTSERIIVPWTVIFLSVLSCEILTMGS